MERRTLLFFFSATFTDVTQELNPVVYCLSPEAGLIASVDSGSVALSDWGILPLKCDTAWSLPDFIDLSCRKARLFLE